MTRVFSTAATAAWAGYHGASALGLVAAAGGMAPPAAALPLTLPDASFLAPAFVAAIAAAHAAVAMTFARVVFALRSSERALAAERLALGALAAGIALAMLSFLLGLGGDAPGPYAAGVGLAVIALVFDRLIAPVEDEVDHERFLRAAASLGARMGRGQAPADHPRAGGTR